MSLTEEFSSAVETKNLLRVRIMLKDSLLVDETFHQFAEMQKFAESKGVNFWMETTNELEILPKAEWNADLMNHELTKLINDFTKERLTYCQHIIKEVCSINSVSSQESSAPSHARTSRAGNTQGAGRTRGINPNHDDYAIILQSVSRINSILKNNKLGEDRKWTYKSINSIREEADKISRACKNVEKRRR